MSDSIKKAFDKAVKHVHTKRGYKPEMLADADCVELVNATANAYREPLRQISLEQEVPPELTAALEQNVFVFSGFKTHHELTEASAMLRDADGGFKPFSKFLSDVQVINTEYNQNYLRAEYNFAQASTGMAVKWKEWEADGDDYNLQYRTAGDDRVREEHAALDGITLPPSDKFWDSYLPPNGWNCRCTAVQVLKYKYPESDSDRAMAAADGIADTPKKQIFKFNPGKQMKVFPDKHPYLPKGCGNCGKTLLSYDPNSEKCRACQAIAKCVDKFQDQERLQNINARSNRKELRQYQSDERIIAKQNPTFSDKGNNYYTKHMYCGSKDMNCLIGHAFTAEEVVACRYVRDLLPTLKNGKYLPIDTSRGNYRRKQTQGVKHFTEYDVEINGEKYVLKCEAIKINGAKHLSEHPYYLHKK